MAAVCCLSIAKTVSDDQQSVSMLIVTSLLPVTVVSYQICCHINCLTGLVSQNYRHLKSSMFVNNELLPLTAVVFFDLVLFHCQRCYFYGCRL